LVQAKVTRETVTIKIGPMSFSHPNRHFTEHFACETEKS
jgi:hypothetical protein